MLKFIKTCERCGKEKEYFLLDENNPDSLICGCGKSSHHQNDSLNFITIDSFANAKNKKSSSCCGGGHCATN